MRYTDAGQAAVIRDIKSTDAYAGALERASRSTPGAAAPAARQVLEARGWVTRAKQEAAEQPVPVFDVLLSERAAKTEAEEKDQENESLDLLDRTGRGVKDAGRKVGDLIRERFD